MPELDPMTYQWSVTNQPAGANALLAAPTNATTTVSEAYGGWNIRFQCWRAGPVQYFLPTSIFARLQYQSAPVLGQTGFRIAASYGLVFGAPSGTTHANIELPTSSATLQAGISDLANQ